VSAWKVYGQGRVNKWELYNLAEDPVELNNLVEEYPEKVEELSMLYDDWAAEVGAYEKKELDSLKKASTSLVESN